MEKTRLTEDGGVTKEIISEGTGTECVPKGALVTIHYDGYYFMKSGKKRLFDSSRERGQQFTITAGADQTIPGLDVALLTMKLEEKARVTMAPQYAYGAGGNPHGFHAFGHSIPANATLEMEVQVMRWKLPGEMPSAETLLQVPLEERLAKAAAAKEKGNALYKEKHYNRALNTYIEGMELLEVSPAAADADVKAEKEKRNPVWIPLSLNAAQCKLLLKEPKGALVYCNAVLAEDARNLKALYRAAAAHLDLSDYDRAMEYAKRAQAVRNTKDVRALVQRIKGANREAERKQRAQYAKLFDESKTQPIYDEDTIKQMQQEEADKHRAKCGICGEEMDKIQLARHTIKRHSGTKKEYDL